MDQIKEICNIILNQNLKVCIDTRSNEIINSIFFGIKGVNYNGSEYWKEAIKKGAKYVVIENHKESKKNKNVFCVENTTITLQRVAKLYRTYFDIPVIGITGSNGKTSSKNLISTVLSCKYNICTTLGNYNNHIGVPLSVLNITKKTEIAVIEMGANHVGEIKKLCEIAQPNYGVITNIGKAHIGSFGGLQNIIKAKSELYDYLKKNNGTIFVNKKDLTLKKQIGKYKKYIYYNYSKSENCNIKNYFQYNINTFISIDFNKISVDTRIFGSYNKINIMLAVEIARYFSIQNSKILKSLENHSLSENRSEFIQSKNNQIILDAYNANPTSMNIAIQNFLKIKNKSKILVLGDMHELGKDEVEYHQEIISNLKKKEITEIYLIGKIFQLTKNRIKTVKFKNTQDAEFFFKENIIRNSLILIKGSRKMNLEKLVKFF